MEVLDFKRSDGCSIMYIYSGRLSKFVSFCSKFVVWYSLYRCEGAKLEIPNSTI